MAQPGNLPGEVKYEEYRIMDKPCILIFIIYYFSPERLYSNRCTGNASQRVMNTPRRFLCIYYIQYIPHHYTTPDAHIAWYLFGVRYRAGEYMNTA